MTMTPREEIEDIAAILDESQLEAYANTPDKMLWIDYNLLGCCVFYGAMAHLEDFDFYQWADIAQGELEDVIMRKRPDLEPLINAY